MSKQQHTPGPWSSYPDDNIPGLYTIAPVSRQYGAVAHVERSYKHGSRAHVERAKHDARLIAAAPDLLAALKDLERTAGQAAMFDDPVRVAARAAIKRAEGKA